MEPDRSFRSQNRAREGKYQAPGSIAGLSVLAAGGTFSSAQSRNRSIDVDVVDGYALGRKQEHNHNLTLLQTNGSYTISDRQHF